MPEKNLRASAPSADTPADTPAARIRARREAAGLTQSTLARAVGCPDTHVCRWERGIHAPGPRYARALAAALGGTLEDYLP